MLVPRQWRGGPLAVGRVFWYLRTVELIGHKYSNPPRLDVRVAPINPPRPRRGTLLFTKTVNFTDYEFNNLSINSL